MKTSNEFTTVTTFSKILALILFITLPIIGFLFGMNYQKIISDIPLTDDIACTADAMICPDGTAVGRIPPDCEFEPCPKLIEKVKIGPSSPVEYECPKGDYVDCMPGVRESGIVWECSPDYLHWAQENCPGFKGAAY